MITLAETLRPVRIVAPPAAPEPTRRDRAVSFLAALALHAALLAGGGAALSRGPEYGVEAGFGSVEVELVAAPPAADPAPEAASVPEPVQAEPVAPAAEDNAVAEPAAETAKSEPAPAATAPKSGATGDGSSPVPGTDATTLRASGGARVVDGKPFYLKNPAPKYPEAARRAGQEGLVLLRVEITAKGEASAVAVTRPSGHALLDDAAEKAVRRWRFRPATFAGVPVASVAEVPVRFRLDEREAR